MGDNREIFVLKCVSLCYDFSWVHNPRPWNAIDAFIHYLSLKKKDFSLKRNSE